MEQASILPSDLRALVDWVEARLQDGARKVEVFADLRPGGDVDCNVIITDSTGQTRFPKLSDDALANVRSVLSRRLIETSEVVRLRLRQDISMTEPALVVITDSEEAQRQFQNAFETLKSKISAEPFGQPFASQIARHIEDGATVGRVYDPRDGDAHALWYDGTTYHVGQVNVLFRDFEPKFSFANQAEFVSWLANQSDRTLFELGLNLNQKVIMKSKMARDVL